MSQRSRSQSHNPQTNTPPTTTTNDISERSKKLDQILTKRPVSSNSTLLPEQLIRSRIIENKLVNVKKSGDNRKITELKQIDDKLRIFMEKASQVESQVVGSGLSSRRGSSSLRINTQTSTAQNITKRILTSSQMNSPISPNTSSLMMPPLSARVVSGSGGGGQSGSGQSGGGSGGQSGSGQSGGGSGGQSGGIKSPKNTPPQNINTTPQTTSLSLGSTPLSLGTTTTANIDYPLQHTWTLYYDRRGLNSRSQLHGINYETNLNTICTFSTIRSFWSYFNQMKQPSELETNSNFHLFKSNIKPIWEDPSNEHGGKWTIHNIPTTDVLDVVWSRLVLSVVGECIDDDVCGIVISKRPRGDKIAIWLRGTDFERVFEIGKKILVECELVESSVKIQMEFNAHLDSMKRGSSYNVGSVGRKELSVEGLRRSLSTTERSTTERK